MFAGFLLRDLHDSERAKTELSVAIRLLPENPDPKLEYARCCLFSRNFVDAERILDSISDTSEFHERVKTKLVDLKIQTNCRKADFYATNQEPIKALESIESLRIYFDGINNPDEKMFQRLTRLKRTVTAVKNSLASHAAYERGVAVQQWINDRCSNISGEKDS